MTTPAEQQAAAFQSNLDEVHDELKHSLEELQAIVTTALTAVSTTRHKTPVFNVKNLSVRTNEVVQLHARLQGMYEAKRAYEPKR